MKTSSCEDNVVLDEYCFDPQSARIGDTLNATVFGFQPSNPWEVLIYIKSYTLYINDCIL